MKKPIVRSKFSHIDPVVAPVGDNARFQPQFVAECDINNIVAKYRKTGVVSHVNQARQRFGEFSQFAGLADAWEPVLQANSAFESLPAELRNKFGNSPKSFLAFIDDPDNFQECVALGIYDPLPKDESVVTPPPAAPAPDAPPSDPSPSPAASKK